MCWVFGNGFLMKMVGIILEANGAVVDVGGGGGDATAILVVGVCGKGTMRMACVVVEGSKDQLAAVAVAVAQWPR